MSVTLVIPVHPSLGADVRLILDIILSGGGASEVLNNGGEEVKSQEVYARGGPYHRTPKNFIHIYSGSLPKNQLFALIFLSSSKITFVTDLFYILGRHFICRGIRLLLPLPTTFTRTVQCRHPLLSLGLSSAVTHYFHADCPVPSPTTFTRTVQCRHPLLSRGLSSAVTHYFHSDCPVPSPTTFTRTVQCHHPLFHSNWGMPMGHSLGIL